MFRRAAFILLFASCGPNHKHSPDAGLADAAVVIPPPDACAAGLGCFVVDCAGMGMPDTTISGTVYAPNGTLPLYGVNVYVPATDPGALTTGVTCDKCSADLPGGALSQTTTDEAGHFKLGHVPATSNVPLVIQSGKWRRQLVLPAVTACTDQPATAADTTFPKSRTDASPLTALDANNNPKVDMPFIAVTTGKFDALECLPYKLGIAPSEITNDTGGGHVQLFTNNGTTSNKGQGAKQFAATWPGGAASFGDAQTLWGAKSNLEKYDIVMLSCEGGQYAASKPQSAMDALHDYAGEGGRVFMSHWHNIWIGGEGLDHNAHGLADWEALASWNLGNDELQDDSIATIDQTVPRGMSFATWLDNVGASTTHGQIPISEARYTMLTNDTASSDRTVWIDPAVQGTGGFSSVQDMQFTTPVTAMPEDRCGKVVFSDMHVSSGSTSDPTVAYPGGCAVDAMGNLAPMTPQEKALAFIFFDIASCVGPLQ